MASIAVKGDFTNTEKFLRRLKNEKYTQILEKYGQLGVAALSSSTPTRTGKTASSWNYEIKATGEEIAIIWTNSNIENGWFNVALMIQKGHGTRFGGYVRGIDYINPALKPIFENMTKEIWRKVTLS